MNPTTGLITRNRLAGIAGFSLVSLLLAAAPAQATHNSCSSGSVSFRGSGISISIGNSCQTRSFADSEFECGLERGRCDGERAGYRDGFNGRCFDNDPQVCLTQYSRWFANGYEDGYSKAYCAAFEAGQKARKHSRQHHRSSRRW